MLTKNIITKQGSTSRKTYLTHGKFAAVNRWPKVFTKQFPIHYLVKLLQKQMLYHKTVWYNRKQKFPVTAQQVATAFARKLRHE